MESNTRKRALDVGVTLGLMATFVAASLVLSPTAPPVGPQDNSGSEQLAFDDTDGSTTSTSGPGAVAPNAGQPAQPGTDQQPTTTNGDVVSSDPQPSENDNDSSTAGVPVTRPSPQGPAETTTAQPPAIGTSNGPLPGDWKYNWGFDPGVRSRIANLQPQNSVDAAAFGVVADDGRDDHAAIAAALDSLGSNGGRVVLPAGSIQTSQTINLSSGQVLRGAGSYETTIVFTSDLTHGIELGGGYPQDGGVVTESTEDGLQLVIRTANPPAAGQLAVVRGGQAPSDEAGQIVSVRSVEAAGADWRVHLNDPIAQDLVGASFSPFDPGRNMGLENMNLTPAANSNVDYHIVLRATENSWVTNVRSEWATRAHLYTRQSYRCEVRDNTFVEATNKGDGGHGYGLNIANNTTGCLFMQNRLALLRHSVLLHGGATANVVAYNTSTDPRHPNFTNGGPSDMSFHGYAVGNLVEGNIFERTQLTDAGVAGPDNAIVRNCFTSGPVTLKNTPQRAVIRGNSILGTNDALKRSTMPAVEWADPRAYTKSDLFDADGVLIQGDAPGLAIEGNWHNGTVDGASPRSAFALVELTPATPTGNAETDCPYAP